MIRKSLDTEVTGVDLYHGATPFLVTFCDESWNNSWYEWDVDPLTRKVLVDADDIEAILAEIEEADELVLQNGKFDVSALLPLLPKTFRWPWPKVRDTILGGHLLASNHAHDLTSMAIETLAVNIQKYDDACKKAVMFVRRIVQRKDSLIGDWRIAKEGLPEMPSAKTGTKRTEDNPWKADLWLPRAFVKWGIETDNVDLLPEEEIDDVANHSFNTVTADYANTDSSTTLALHNAQIKKIRAKGLEPIYNERLRLLPITQRMEQRGVSLSGERLGKLQVEFKEESAKCERMCKNIAAGYDGYELNLPKSGNNKSLTEFVFNVMKLPKVLWTDKGNARLNSDALGIYAVTLPPRSKELKWVESLQNKRKVDTAIGYMTSYVRFWHPLGIFNDKGEQLWFLVHPSLNITGTDTLRWSSHNPNEQNISKKEGYNVRYCFGPAPGREWWSLDAKNIELRLPAYEAKEQELTDLFEHPDDPPYYGSTHLLNFHTVYPDLWELELKAVPLEKVGPWCKKKYASTWYQWCKNGGFAVQYGAVEREEGTADRAFHRVGSHTLLKQRFSKLEDLNQYWIEYANRTGYVETLPDKTISPDKGYPLLCTRSERGRIKPTVPLNYHVQGSAMWWTARGMVRCQERLDEWEDKEGFDGFMTMQVHDELVFDMPKGRGSRPWIRNLDKVKELAHSMSLGGDDFGIPTPVGIEYHAETWSEGITL